MSRFAIIPAKSRSTRLPGKNMLELDGIPMVKRVVNTVLSSELFDEVWVSTDSEEIKKLCEEAGANVIIRPSELCEDRSTVNNVCVHWLNNLKCMPDFFCCVYATAVFLKEEDLEKAWNLVSADIDSVMGVSSYNYPPVQAMSPDENGYLRMLLPEYEKVQSQFHPDCSVSNGSQYWARTVEYLKAESFYLDRMIGYLTDDNNILDINTKEDFILAEKRIEILKNSMVG